MKELTKAEEQIMQELWTLEKAFVKEIVDKLPEPKPCIQHGFYDHPYSGKERVC